MTKAEEKRMEAMQTTHLRRIHRIPYTLYVPNEPVRRSSKISSIESRLMEARLRTWSLACRDSPHSFFRATMFGRAADERSSFEKKKQIQYIGLIKTAVSTFSANAHLQLRDWSLDPELLLDAQDMYHAATVEAYPDGEKVLRRPNSYDEPTPTYAGSYLMIIKSHWLAMHLRKSLLAYQESAGIHPTYSLEAVSHLALRE